MKFRSTFLKQAHPAWLLVALCLILLLGGCAGLVVYKGLARRAATPEAVGGPDENQLYKKPEFREEAVVAVSLSGGGLRAAALALGVLEGLDALEVLGRSGANSSLFKEVDYLSGVSGGAMTAAYAALFGKEPGWGERLRQDVLRPNHHLSLLWRVVVNSPRLLATDYSRGDVAGSYYASSLFRGRKFSSLPVRPFLILNATDLTTGSRFEFVRENFRCVGVDLARYPVGRAVAASAAFPVAFAPLTMPKFVPGDCVTDYDKGWLTKEIGERADPYQTWAVRRKQMFLEQAQYLHLSDGGVSDNLGVQAILNRLRAGPLRAWLNTQASKKTPLYLIVVNAAIASDEGLGKASAAPIFPKVVERVSSLLLEHLTHRALSLTKDPSEECQEEDCRVIYVGFDDIPDRTDRQRANEIPTVLNLSKDRYPDTGETQEELLVRVGKQLLWCGQSGANRRHLVTLLHRYWGNARPPTLPAECPPSMTSK